MITFWVEMINFCHASLKPVITCDKVSADDYGVENLVSGGDNWACQRGFRAERFIVAPVAITVRFPCNINIAKIILDPVVGRQKSRGFEVYTAFNNIPKPWLFKVFEDEAGKSSDDNLYQHYVLIGRSRLKEAVPVCFENPNYRARPPFLEFGCPVTDGMVCSTLKHHKACAIVAVSALTIRIVDTVERSAPALKRLQVWGQPSLSCKNFIQTRVYELYKAATTQVVPLPSNRINFVHDGLSKAATEPTYNSCHLATSKEKPLSNIPQSSQLSVDIPEDFVDPITCDIMAIPLTLPSGKTVDQYTLDQHINAEASWGRPPSDPFTGVPFSNSQKPVPNTALKLRIDKFVMNHSEELKTVPRTLGRGDNYRLTAHNFNSPQVFSSVTCNNTLVEPKECANRKRKAEAFKVDLTADSSARNNHSVPKAKVVKLEADVNLEHKLPVNHKDKLSQSLDAALFATLGNLPSFQTTSIPNHTASSSDVHPHTSQPQPPACVSCHSTSDLITLYKLSCSHVTCRQCLTKTLGSNSSAKCPGCNKVFVSKDVVKLNV